MTPTSLMCLRRACSLLAADRIASRGNALRTPYNCWPEEAGSCAFAVTDLDTMRAELDGRGLDLGTIRIDEWDGKKYRVFFLREAENGYCYCFSQQVAEG